MQFLCTNCSIISEVSKIEDDDKKRNKAKDVQKEIDYIESQIKKEESKWPIFRNCSGFLYMDVLNKTILKNKYETEHRFIECPVCKKQHYIKDVGNVKQQIAIS